MSGRASVDLALALAVLVVVPTGTRLHPGRQVPWAVLVAAGVPAAGALLLGPGAVAGAATIPWLLASIVVAVQAIRRWLAAPFLWSADIAWPVAAAYLVVGAAWLAADRFGIEPVGVDRPFVELTAVHFHYAGFAAATLAGCTWRRLGRRPAAGIATWLVLVAPPLVALGFTVFGALQVVGAVLLTAGLWLGSWLVLARVVPTLASRPRAPRWLLVASALSVLAPMVLAVHWAAGTNLGFRVLSIPDMAVLHGLVNAVGFTLAGLVGWLLAAE